MANKTNYDAIKNMSIDEMAAVFYMFMRPILEAFKLDDAEHKQKVRNTIKAFLNAEVKTNSK